jgi:hypothetical protein
MWGIILDPEVQISHNYMIYMDMTIGLRVWLGSCKFSQQVTRDKGGSHRPGEVPSICYCR